MSGLRSDLRAPITLTVDETARLLAARTADARKLVLADIDRRVARGEPHHDDHDRHAAEREETRALIERLESAHRTPPQK